MPRFHCALLLPFLLAVGCSQPTQKALSTQGGGSQGDTEVRQAWQTLQTAIKAKDAEKIWVLLDDDSHTDADRVAKSLADDYAKAAALQKTEQEKKLGLTAAEFSNMSGKTFLKSKRFMGKYDELGESKLDSVTVQGNKATIAYTEADGDKEKLTLNKQGNDWKVSLPMPAAK